MSHELHALLPPVTTASLA